MTTYKTYDEIPQDVFAETIRDLAADDVNNLLFMTGIWEIISEEYNNAALNILCPNPPETEQPA